MARKTGWLNAEQSRDALSASNGVVLQGVVSGPMGDHKEASLWVTGVHDYELSDGPSHLEAVLVYPVECDDCPGEEVVTVQIESAKSTPKKPAALLRVESLAVVDLDKDGTHEIVLDTRYRPCCEGDAERHPYAETIVLKVDGTTVRRWPEGQRLVRDQ